MREQRFCGSRRDRARVPLDVPFAEYVAERQTLGLIVDASEHGLRVQRLLRGRTPSGVVQLELELPGTGEVIWAKGQICFDRLSATALGTPVRTSGVRLVAAARKHLRLLADWVAEARKSETLDRRRSVRLDGGDDDWWRRASIYR